MDLKQRMEERRKYFGLKRLKAEWQWHRLNANGGAGWRRKLLLIRLRIQLLFYERQYKNTQAMLCRL